MRTLFSLLVVTALFAGACQQNNPQIGSDTCTDTVAADTIAIDSIKTDYGDLLRLKLDMNSLSMDMVCGTIPGSDNDSIILVFAGAFTGTDFGAGHSNVAGDHVAGGKRYAGYNCRRNTGAFTWSAKSGHQFFYKNYSEALDRAADEGGMGFTQEMMIHSGKAVPTTRPKANENIFRALCQDADGKLALYESRNYIKFGDFIKALLSQGVVEALYTDMGEGWNYCFFRTSSSTTPIFLHPYFVAEASNFVIVKKK